MVKKSFIDGIYVGMPTRGLVNSRTLERLFRNDIQRINFIHQKPIPLCFNQMADKFMKSGKKYLWIVEEDVLVPKTFLKQVEKNLKEASIFISSYPIGSDEYAVTSTKRWRKQILFFATGCVVIKREVFEGIKKPYFETTGKWNMRVEDRCWIDQKTFKITKKEVLKLEKRDEEYEYGGQDINFSRKVIDANFKIKELAKSGHMKCIKLGEAGVNNGVHQFMRHAKPSKQSTIL